MFTFIESPSFSTQLADLWTDAEYAAFQQFLATHPETGDVIPGLGGLRKVRWAAKGKGKRGGARVIYLLLVLPGIIYLFHAYTKGDITDLSPEQKKRLRVAVEEIKAQFQS
jgi:mRNA-degrading endonuclease RelE of RelBE toxin-antitoxin system